MPAKAKDAHKARCSSLHISETSRSILLVSGPHLTTPVTAAHSIRGSQADLLTSPNPALPFLEST